MPCPRFALSIENLRTHKAPQILVRNGGPASFSPDGKSLAYVAENQLVLRVLANGTSTSIKTGKLVTDDEHSSGVAAALSHEPPVERAARQVT